MDEQQQIRYESIIGRLYVDLIAARGIIANYQFRVAELEQQILHLSSDAPPDKEVSEIPLEGKTLDIQNKRKVVKSKPNNEA